MRNFSPDDRERTDQVLARLAKNHVVDRREALSEGVSEDELRTRLVNGVLSGDGSAAYLTLGAQREGATAKQAACTAARGLAVGLWSALHAHGVIRGTGPDVVHVLVPWKRRVKSTGWYSTSRVRRLEDDDLVDIQGVLHTTVARSIRDLAARLPFEDWADRQLTRWIEEAMILGVLTLADLETQRQRERSNKVRARLKRLLDHQRGGDPTEFRSRLETWLRDLVRRRGLPEPEWNVKPRGFTRELDAYWAGKLIVESDGFRYHRTRTKHDRDKRSDRRHLRRGVPTVRITQTDYEQDREQLESDIVFFVTGADDGTG